MLTACATTKPAPIEEPPEVEPIIAPDTKLIDEILLYITICSPASLEKALQLLEGSDLGSSEYGGELKYVTVTLAHILYPEIAEDFPAVPSQPGGMYPALFEKIRAGKFPVVPQEEASFLTLIIPPMACLFTSDPVVLEQCSEALLQADSLETRSVLPPYLLGMIGEKRKRWHEAMEYYEEVLETDDSCYPAEIGWARAALETGKVGEALQHLEILAERFPENTMVMYLRSYGNYLQGDFIRALELNTDALWVKPENPSYLLLRARILEAQGNVEQAGRILLIVEKKIPENLETVYLRARILYRQQNYEQAAEILEEALLTYPEAEKLDELYGEVLIAAGRTDEAGAYLEEKLEQDPKNIRSLELLTMEARKAEEWEKAAEYIERLLVLENRDKHLEMAADIYRALGDWEKTLLYARELYENGYGGNDTILLYLESLIQTGRTEEAEAVARDTLADVMDSEARSALYYQLSRVLDDRNERLDALRSSLLENLHNLDALVALADLYAEGGDYRKAYRYINQAYMLAPEDPHIRSELRRIEELAK